MSPAEAERLGSAADAGPVPSAPLAGAAQSPWCASSAKRLFDLLVSVPALLAALPVLLLLGIAVRLSSPGPAVFAQARLGRGERPFTCRKLRSMRLGTPSVATHEAPLDAVTPLGRMLRASKLDELPQLWNVVKGEMSLVGPRPGLAGQAELADHRRRLGVFALRPGITGLAQVRGVDMSDPLLCARNDADYAATASFGADLAILSRTLLPRRLFP